MIRSFDSIPVVILNILLLNRITFSFSDLLGITEATPMGNLNNHLNYNMMKATQHMWNKYYKAMVLTLSMEPGVKSVGNNRKIFILELKKGKELFYRYFANTLVKYAA